MARRIKGQISLEFMILVGIGFLLLISVVSMSFSELKKIQDKKEQNIVMNFANNIYDEVNIATNAHEGYTRQFKIKDDKLNFYTVNNYLIVESTKFEYEKKLNNFEGKFKEGMNEISKKNGIVKVN